MSWWHLGKFSRGARLPSRDLAREMVGGDVVQGEGFRAQARDRLRPRALDAGAQAVSGAPEHCRQVGSDWNLGPRRQPRGDRPCHDADTLGGQSCAAGMAGAADGGPRRAAALRCGKADAGESGEHARPREFSRQAAPSPAGTDTTGSRTLPACRQGLATPGTGRAGRLSRGRPRPRAPQSRAPWPA